jgi:hypothetical protein
VGLVYATPSAIYKGIGVFYGFDTVFATAIIVAQYIFATARSLSVDAGFGQGATTIMHR